MVNKMRNNFEQLLPFNKKEKSINDIIRFFEEERGEQLGLIGSEKFLNFILKDIGKDIYEKAVEDSKLVLRERFEDIELDLDLLINK